MKKIRLLTAVTALSLVSIPGTVAASTAQGAPSSAVSIADLDMPSISGAVYYYSGPNYTDLCDTTNLLTHTYGPCANTDLSLFNDVPGYRVRFYFSANKQGAWICLDYGEAVTDDAPLVFDQGPNRAGYNKTIWDNVHSEELLAGGAGCAPNE